MTRGWLTIPGQHAVVVLVSGPDGVRDGGSEPNAPECKGNSGLYGVGNDLATEAISSRDVNKLVDDRQTGDDDVEGEYAAVVAEVSVLISVPAIAYRRSRWTHGRNGLTLSV
jgi:hypothetical protein